MDMFGEFFKASFIKVSTFYCNIIKYCSTSFFFTPLYKMNIFVNITKGLKSSSLDPWLGSKYTSEVCPSRVIFNKIDL